jgi:hypothetical protein
MAADPIGGLVEVAEDGEVVALADVTSLEGKGVVRAELHARAGQLPVGTRARLVDAVLDLAEARDGNRLEATIPLGDVESLDRLRECCDDVHARPAGASCLVDAALPSETAKQVRPRSA